MSTVTPLAQYAIPAPMSVFERYLTVWVFLSIVVGIALGQLLPGPFQAIGRMEVAQVNLPVGLLIWVMLIPNLPGATLTAGTPRRAVAFTAGSAGSQYRRSSSSRQSRRAKWPCRLQV